VSFDDPLLVSNEQIGNGSYVGFTGILTKPYVVPGTIVIHAGSQTVTDDGSGNLIGDISTDPMDPNTIVYSTGVIVVTFRSSVPNGIPIYVTYDTTTLAVYKNISGVLSLIQRVDTFNLTPGSYYGIRFEDTAITVYQNGSPLILCYDSSLTAQGYTAIEFTVAQSIDIDDLSVVSSVHDLLSINAYLQSPKTLLVSIDSYLQIKPTKTLTIDAFLRRHIIDIDSLIQLLDIIQTVSIDAFLERSINIDADLTAIDQTKTVSIDGGLNNLNTQIVTLDAYLTNTYIPGIGIDSVFIETLTRDVAIDGRLYKQVLLETTLDAILRGHTIALDALLNKSQLQTVGVDFTRFILNDGGSCPDTDLFGTGSLFNPGKIRLISGLTDSVNTDISSVGAGDLILVPRDLGEAGICDTYHTPGITLIGG
jgi:hypothetical protein